MEGEGKREALERRDKGGGKEGEMMDAISFWLTLERMGEIEGHRSEKRRRTDKRGGGVLWRFANKKKRRGERY